ncbi:MAG: sugar transferase [Pseudomonadota bacterium]
MTVHFHSVPDSDASPIKVESGLYDRLGSFYNRIGKRILDCSAIILALPIVVPLLVLVTAAVAVSGGKPFYFQDRVGLGGRTFRIWKFRSMVHDADKILSSYLDANPAARAEWDATQKLKDDPRITPIGKFIRKSSIDELPQLINVLLGDMSLVGPRPMLPEQQSMYPGKAYFALRPGITGLWQVSERNECEFADRAYYDSEYGRTVSLRTDLQVLARTVGVVLRGTGY